MGNSLLNFFKWVDYRVLEQVSKEEVGLRNKLARATREYDEYMITEWLGLGLGLGVENRATKDEEVHKVINYYINLGYLLDSVFSLAMTESGRLDEEIILRLQRMIKAVLKMCSSMMLSMKAPKIH